MEDMEATSVDCVAHALKRSVIEPLATARKIVGHFKHSPLAYSRLEDIQKDLKMDVKRLQQDVQMRWNSSLYMLQSILEQKRALSVYAADYSLPATLTANQWTLMEKTAEVLAPFEELKRDVSNPTASAADVTPAITALKRVLSREKTTDQGVRTIRARSFFTKSDNLRLATDNLIMEVAKIERAASEEPEAAEPMRKTPRQEASSSLGSVLNENQLEARSVSTSADLQVQSKPALGKAIPYTTGKIMLHGSPHWLLLQPGFSVPPAPLWTVRDSLVQCPTSLMRKGTGSHLTG
ncbi:hypothetical protein JOQ06_011459 [Pogonophryne albipinna]|uniref:Uncharacterized protein n=1 Tax=Pogonophryne albipinna TaxID=1090488 RepID=A0AAD6BDN3_9TELE|nr:hypothetical protein JOQ06_011459 [Pogonophryne albipinna]